MAYSALIGRRTVLSRENRLLINMTTWIAVMGVALGVAALIVVNAVYDGYIAEIRQRFVSVLSHVDVFGPGGIRGDEDFLDFLESQPGVEAAAPVLTRQGLLMPRGSWSAKRVAAQIMGIDVERTRRVSNLLGAVTAGSMDPGSDGVVLGAALAQRLGVDVGDAIVLLADFDTSGRRPRPRTRTLQVAGLFESGFYQFDQSLAYVALATAHDAYEIPPEAADLIQLRLEDPWQAAAVAADLRSRLGYGAQTWRERFPQFFAGVELTRMVLLLLLLLLIAVASTNVIGSLVMIVHDRTRQIGILRAMGATRGALARIYLLCGLFIGGLGVAVGLGLAMLVCAAVAQWEIITVPASVYFIDHLPVYLDWTKIGAVSVITVLICLVAALVPALRAARLDPVEALRYE